LLRPTDVSCGPACRVPNRRHVAQSIGECACSTRGVSCYGCVASAAAPNPPTGTLLFRPCDGGTGPHRHSHAAFRFPHKRAHALINLSRGHATRPSLPGRWTWARPHGPRAPAPHWPAPRCQTALSYHATSCHQLTARKEDEKDRDIVLLFTPWKGGWNNVCHFTRARCLH
jgi:hypothetical protein